MKKRLRAALPALALSLAIAGSGEYLAVADDASSELGGFNPASAARGPSNDTAKALLQSGAFSYEISVESPPGIGGVSPQLAFSYNSRGGEGWIGSGWDIPIDRIERSTKNGVPSYGPSDTFVLISGGQARDLVAVGAEYRLRVDDGEGLRLLFDSAANTWTVLEKDGTASRFGTNPASRVTGPGGVSTWCLDAVRDRTGNTFRYSYQADQNVLYPSAVTYGEFTDANGLTLRNPDRKLSLTVESRTDPIVTYRFGLRQVIARRVSAVETWIQVAGAWQKVRRYTLSYTTPPNRVHCLLASVQVAGFDAGETNAVSLPPWTFAYADSKPGWTRQADNSVLNIPRSVVAYESGIGTRDNGVRFFDADGDGRMDLAQSMTANPSVRDVFLNQPAGWVAAPSDGRLVLPIDADMTASTYRVRENGASFVDLNGDGIADIARYHWNAGVETVQSWIGTGKGWTPAPSFRLPAGAALTVSDDGQKWSRDNGVQFADMNGDGLIDVVQSVFYRGGGTFANHVWLNTGNGWTQDDRFSLSPLNLAITVVSNNNWYSRPNGTVLIDLNGDGLADVVQAVKDYDTGNLYFHVWLNKGPGWEEVTSTWRPPDFIDVYFESGGPFGAYNNGVEFADINGDGLPDWIENRHWDNGDHRCVYLNNGNGWTNVTDQWSFPDYFIKPYVNNGFLFVDVNGDGMSDLVQALSMNGEKRYVGLSSASRPVLTQVGTPQGGVIAINYKALGLVSGKHAVPFLLPVVTTIDRRDGRGTTQTDTFTYDGGRYDPTEKEFLGFSSAVRTDAEGDRFVAYFHQDKTLNGDPVPHSALRGKAYREETYDANGRLLYTEETTWSYTDAGSISVRKDAVQKMYAGSRPLTSRTEYSYDDVGDVTETRDWGDVAKTGDERRETVDYAAPAGTTWIRSLPSQRTSYAPDGTVLSQTAYLYDGPEGGAALPLGTVQDGRLTEIRRRLISEGRWLSEKKLYNAYGQVRTSYDAKGNPTTFGFDDYQFPAAVTNAFGHVTKTTRDPRTGQRLSVTDPNQKVTRYAYDSLGRLTSIIRPTESSTYPSAIYDYHNDLIGQPGAQYTETRRPSDFGSPYVVTRKYYDGFGRVYQTATTADATNWKVRETRFDDRGLESKQSIPRYSSGSDPVQWTTTRYDALGRTTDISEPDGATTSIRYDGATSVRTDPIGRDRVTTVDAYGDVVERSDSGVPGSVTYQFDALGHLVNVSDALGRVTSMTYDSLGRRTSISDPNSGLTTFAYDDNENLIRKTDARNVAVRFDHDALNRLTAKTLVADPSGVTGTPVGHVLGTFTYDAYPDLLYGLASLGYLVQTENENAKVSYVYDDDGRRVKEITAIGPTEYWSGTSYTPGDAVLARGFPNDVEADYSFDKGGRIKNISKYGGPIYASFAAYDASDRPLELRQADGSVSTTYAYDGERQVLTALKTVYSDGTVGRDLTYGYDAARQLKSVVDHADRSADQGFDYDEDGRLAQAVGPYGDQTYQYSPTGDLLLKGNFSLSYDDAARPGLTTSMQPTFQDPSAILQWSFEPTEPIYSISGRLTNMAFDGIPNTPVTMSGLVEQTVLTDSSTVDGRTGSYQFRGLPGLSDAIYAVSPSTTTLLFAPTGAVFSPLVRNETASFSAASNPSPLNPSALRLARTALGMGGAPLSSAAFSGAVIGGLGYGGASMSGGSVAGRSGFSPIADSSDTASEPPDSTVPPPGAAASAVIGPCFVDGIVRKALFFNGTTDVFAFPGTRAANPSQFTVAVWIKLAATPSAGIGTVLAKTRLASGAPTVGFRLGIDSARRPTFQLIGTTTSAVAMSTVPVALNSWTFLAATYSGSAAALYIDGKPVAQTPFSGFIDNDALITAAALLDPINRIADHTQLRGAIDEPRLFSGAWAPADIQRAYQAFQQAMVYRYDAAGNRVEATSSQGQTTYSYDAEGRLREVDRNGAVVESFGYDAEGHRVYKQSPDGKTLYLNKDFEIRPGNVEVCHVFAGAQEVVQIVQNGTSISPEYPQVDHLNSIVGVADAAGRRTARMEYEPFGHLFEESGATSSRRRFTSKEMDTQTGLYSFDTREYDPTLGRFISPDPALATLTPQYASDPKNLCSYAYAKNNPLRFADPDGGIAMLAAALAIPGVAEAAAVLGTYAALVAESPETMADFQMLLNDFSRGDHVGVAMDAVAVGTPGLSAAFLHDARDGLKTAREIASPPSLGTAGVIDSGIVRFTQNSIDSLFKDKRAVNELVEGLQNGSIKPWSIPAIRLVIKDGKLYSLDNRRLEAFKRAEMEVPFRMATEEEIAKEWLKKFTTKNDGISIRVRGENR